MLLDENIESMIQAIKEALEELEDTFDAVKEYLESLWAVTEHTLVCLHYGNTTTIAHKFRILSNEPADFTSGFL